jgi:hypothetical protein
MALGAKNSQFVSMVSSGKGQMAENAFVPESSGVFLFCEPELRSSLYNLEQFTSIVKPDGLYAQASSIAGIRVVSGHGFVAPSPRHRS